MDLKDFRQQKDSFFLDDHHSPLSDEQKDQFQGLKYYPENPDLRFVTTITPNQEDKWIKIQTNTGEIQKYLQYGKLQFEVEGKKTDLTVFQTETGDLTTFFKDNTSGKETYGAGRYLELEHLNGDQFLVDFNLAYNPWCAYSPRYSCPMPPEENRLKVAIQAGEMNFS